MKWLIGVLVLIYVAVVVTGGVAGNAWLYGEFGLSLEGLRAGKVWQLVTYALLHGSVSHLMVNVVLLGVLVRSLRRLQVGLGVWGNYGVLLAGVIVGGVFQLVYDTASLEGAGKLLVGISGGVMGLLLALTVQDPYRNAFGSMVGSPISLRHLGVGFLVSESLMVLVDPVLGLAGFMEVGLWMQAWLGDEVFHVAHACHVGGGLAGLVVARCGAYFVLEK